MYRKCSALEAISGAEHAGRGYDATFSVDSNLEVEDRCCKMSECTWVEFDNRSQSETHNRILILHSVTAASLLYYCSVAVQKSRSCHFEVAIAACKLE